MIKYSMRHLARYKEIISLFVKYGFGYLVEEVGLSSLLSVKERLTADFERGDVKEIGSRTRHLLEELGPTFIKLGQLLSIRSDLLPSEIIYELEKLQDDVPSVPGEEIKEKVEQELGAPVEEIFAAFHVECFAAASIGQVHEAVLPTGENVMVKVQRPGIATTVRTDLEILMDLSKLMEERYEWAHHYRLTDMIEELAESIKNELDYLEEGRNTETIQFQFEKHESIKVPKIYWDYTTSQILTMERINGIKLTELGEPFSKEEKNEIADLLVGAFVKQILQEGFFQGDPHPGNILYIPKKKQVALIDFGQVGRLSDPMRYDVTSLMIGLMREDTDMIVKAVYRFAHVPASVDDKQFYDDLDRIRRKFSHVPLGQLQLGLTMNELFATAQRHRILIPKDFTMMGKSLMTVEGIISDLDPSLSLLALARPYGEKLLRERYDPRRWSKRLWDEAEDLSGTLSELPGHLKEVLQKTSEGDLRAEIRFSDLQRILNKLDRISNQMSFSLTLLAFSIVVLGVIVGATFGSGTILTSVPAVEIGFVVAFVMFLWIIYSILKSGRF